MILYEGKIADQKITEAYRIRNNKLAETVSIPYSFFETVLKKDKKEFVYYKDPRFEIQYLETDRRITLMFSDKGGPRMIILHDGDKKIKGYLYSLPTIYLYKDGELRVWWVNNGVLYRPMLPNIYQDMKVCLGNTKIIDTNNINILMNSIYDTFWSSDFTGFKSENVIGYINKYLSQTVDGCKYNLKKLKQCKENSEALPLIRTIPEISIQ
jgi:hypothetical protein